MNGIQDDAIASRAIIPACSKAMAVFQRCLALVVATTGVGARVEQ